MTFASGNLVGKMFNDEYFIQTRPCSEVVVVDGANEGGMDW